MVKHSLSFFIPHPRTTSVILSAGRKAGAEESAFPSSVTAYAVPPFRLRCPKFLIRYSLMKF